MNEYTRDVCYSAATKVKALEIDAVVNNYNIALMGDKHELIPLLMETYKGLMDKNINNEVIKVESVEELKAHQFTNDNPVSLLYLVNLRDNKYANNNEARTQAAATLEECLKYNEENRDNLFQLSICIPEIKESLPEGVNAISEREYEVVFRDYPEDSLEKLVISLERQVRLHYEQTERLQVVRLDRIYGPGISNDCGLGINQLFEDIRKGKPIVIRDEDRYNYFSASYVQDTIVAMILALMSGRKGNIYNISSHRTTRFRVISGILQKFTDEDIKLETEHDEKQHEVKYRLLNPNKLRLVHKKPIANTLFTRLDTAIDKTGHWVLEREDYLQKNDLNVYFGKMERIRQIELEILKEVDKICKENDIEYFIAAGTQLGAVRHKGFIPWDDDVDIGMLPEAYEKFLKVCPKSLDVEYGYQNVSTEKTSHYIHDKIRLKNSFFSTKYSDKYEMLNGVYIDVFVYYKTANTKFFQDRHIRQVAFWRKLIGARWATTKRKSKAFNLLFDLTHLVPASWIDKRYRRILMKYNWRNTRYRIDGGFNLEVVRAVPDEWFHGTVDGEFCGHTFPILEHYNDYLSHWYSSHYMELLPISARASVHDVIRIDLGQNLFAETAHDKRFRDVDLRGELFEKEK